MANRRPWHCYSKWTRRPYQYKRSSNRKREYARGGSQSKIVRYWGGNTNIPWEEWDVILGLKCTKQIQLSSNALEAIRVTINSSLQKKLGRNNFHLRIRPKPFQKIRENRMLAFAGADRVQQGMRLSFGRATGVCARIRGGAIICEVGCELKNVDYIRDRFRVASMKVPCKCTTVVIGYKSLEILKRTGLPLYDPVKHRDIPIYNLSSSTTQALN